MIMYKQILGNNTMKTLLGLPNFFNSCEGVWESQRTYCYPNRKAFTQLTTYMDMRLVDQSINVRWSSRKTDQDRIILEGGKEMLITIDGQYLKRSRGYFTTEETASEILELTNSKLHTKTEYNGNVFFEEIEFVTPELRTRRTVGFNKDNNVEIVGTYVELKIND